MLLHLGKDRKAYLLDRNKLGGFGGQLAAETVSDLRIITAPAAYPVGSDVFVAFQARSERTARGLRRFETLIAAQDRLYLAVDAFTRSLIEHRKI